MAKKKTVKKSAAKKSTTKKKTKKKSTKKAAPSASTASPVGGKIAERRFELVEGSAAKFWTIQLDDDRVITKHGRLGSSGQSTEKHYDDDAKVLKAYDKLVQQKTGKGYYEIKAPTEKSAAELKRERKDHQPFLKAILNDPDDVAAYAIYGDWLSERGDPRGELMALHGIDAAAVVKATLSMMG